MQVKAHAKALRISPRKLGLVAGLVRRRELKDGLVILEHTPNKGADLLKTILNSAQANAENNFKLNPEGLFIEQVLVSPGPMMKRHRAAARGQVHAIMHRTANVSVTLQEQAPVAAKAPSKARPSAKGKGA